MQKISDHIARAMHFLRVTSDAQLIYRMPNQALGVVITNIDGRLYSIAAEHRPKQCEHVRRVTRPLSNLLMYSTIAVDYMLE